MAGQRNIRILITFSKAEDKLAEFISGLILGADKVKNNSPNNLSNPDPTLEVRWGNQTRDEMLIGYFDIAVPRAESPDEDNPAGE